MNEYFRIMKLWFPLITWNAHVASIAAVALSNVEVKKFTIFWLDEAADKASMCFDVFKCRTILALPPDAIEKFPLHFLQKTSLLLLVVWIFLFQIGVENAFDFQRIRHFFTKWKSKKRTRKLHTVRLSRKRTMKWKMAFKLQMSKQRECMCNCVCVCDFSFVAAKLVFGERSGLMCIHIEDNDELIVHFLVEWKVLNQWR